MAVLNTGLAKTPADTGYTIDYSCRFDAASSAYLSKTPSAGNRKTWTWSAWVKRGNLVGSGTRQVLFSGTGITHTTFGDIRFDVGDDLHIGTYTVQVALTSALFRDPSAWYSIIVVMDTTQGTEADRLKIYVNGVEQSLAVDNRDNLLQDTDYGINSAVEHAIGRNEQDNNWYLDGYLAEVHFIDGTALDHTSFGETGDYGEWKPIEYTGSHGTQGFYLDFADSAALGDDAAGSNDWTVNNLTAADQMLDTPTNNFATWNPNHKRKVNLKEGNLAIEGSRTGNNYGIASTFLMESGKWYWEFCRPNVSGATNSGVHIADSHVNKDAYNSSDHWSFAMDTGYAGGDDFKKNTGGTATTFTGSGVLATTDILQIAFDADAGKIWFGKNNTWLDSGDPAAGTGEIYSGISDASGILASHEDASAPDFTHYNFGADSSFAGEQTAQGNADGNGYGDFYYTPPSGFLAKCTANLPVPAVIPSEHFQTAIYTGTDSTRSINLQDFAADGTSTFQPDMIWVKKRSTSGNHCIWDAVRGVANRIRPDTTAAEDTGAALGSFDTDGFTLSGSVFNNDSVTFVAWNWKANGSGSSNTNGSINTTATSANTDAGFSISTYSGDGNAGATVGHGLSKAPEFVMIKRRDAIDNWPVHHGYNTTAPETERLYLDTNGATYDDDVQFNDTLPSATVVTIGDNDQVNNSSGTYVMYCWHSVEGYSKVGTYTGKTSNDPSGCFITTGFRPAYVLLKRADSANNWGIYDTARDTYNLTHKSLYPDVNNAENDTIWSTTENTIDILSNGFKMRTSNAGTNAAGGAYIYIAFAETPFRYSNAR
jgi:hypothetical protein